MRAQPALPYAAGAAVTKRRIVKFSADLTVVQAAAATDALVGVADSLGAEAAGARCEVYVAGVVEVEAGGNITRGAFVTSDANGRAVAAAPAAGANNRVIGIAQASAVSGDIVDVLLAPGQIQG
jgi:hypothetical protein